MTRSDNCLYLPELKRFADSRAPKCLEEISNGKDFVAASGLVISPKDKIDSLLLRVVLHGEACSWRLVCRDEFVPKHELGLLGGGVVDASVLGKGLRFSV